MMLEILVAQRSFDAWFAKDDLPVALRAAFDGDGKRLCAKGPGVFAVGGRLAVVVPRIFDGVDDDAQRVAAVGQSVRVLRRYMEARKDQKSVLATDDEAAIAAHGDVASLFDQVDARLALWSDWQANGSLAIVRRRLAHDGRGRTHWPRTISTTPSVLSHVDVLYPAPVTSRHAIDPEHPVVRLHEQTCAEAGAWLGFKRVHRRSLAAGPREAIAILDRHGRSLFEDRQRDVAAMLRQYFAPAHAEKSRGGQETKGVVATNFPAIWEAMLRVALGPTTDADLPTGRYAHTDGKTTPATSFRIDLLLDAVHDGEPVKLVLDAKDYERDSLPQHYDVNKQLLYRLLVSHRHAIPLESVGNAFVIPAAIERARAVDAIAVHDLIGDAGATAPFGRIICLHVDFGRAADAYATRRADTLLRSALVEMTMERMRA